MVKIKFKIAEIHQLLIDLKCALSPFSPFNNFLGEFDIDTSKELMDKNYNLEVNNLSPVSDSLMQSFKILSRPEQSFSLLSRVNSKVSNAEFYINKDHVVQYSYDNTGINYIHEPVSKTLFMSYIMGLFKDNIALDSRDDEVKLIYIFTYPEYIVISSIFHLQKESIINEIVNDCHETGFTKNDIIEHIQKGEQFQNIWLLLNLEIINIDDFLLDIKNQVEITVDSFLTKQYINQYDNTENLFMTSKMQPLFELINSSQKSILSLSTTKYPTLNSPDLYQNGMSMMFNQDIVYAIKFKNSKLNFYQLFNEDQLLDVFLQQVFFIDNSRDEKSNTLSEKEVNIQSDKQIYKCPSCGFSVDKNQKFCTACGLKLPENIQSVKDIPEVKKCANCNAELKADVKFCTQCGAKVGEAISSEGIE